MKRVLTSGLASALALHDLPLTAARAGAQPHGYASQQESAGMRQPGSAQRRRAADRDSTTCGLMQQSRVVNHGGDFLPGPVQPAACCSTRWCATTRLCIPTRICGHAAARQRIAAARSGSGRHGWAAAARAGAQPRRRLSASGYARLRMVLVARARNHGGHPSQQRAQPCGLVQREHGRWQGVQRPGYSVAVGSALGGSGCA